MTDALPREFLIPTIGRRPGPDHTALQTDLEAAVDAEIRFDAGSKGAYSTNFGQVPIA